MILLIGSVVTAVAEEPDAAAIRAGHNLATSVRFVCHVISPDQTVAPVMGPGIRSFDEIASRPDVTAEALVQSMKSAAWHDPALPAQRLLMSHLSDRERLQVAEYILSFKRARQLRLNALCRSVSANGGTDQFRGNQRAVARAL